MLPRELSLFIMCLFTVRVCDLKTGSRLTHFYISMTYHLNKEDTKLGGGMRQTWKDLGEGVNILHGIVKVLIYKTEKNLSIEIEAG